MHISLYCSPYNLGQNCWDILMQFSISRHATIVSKRSKFAPLPTPGAMLFWLHSSSAHFLCYCKQHCNRWGGKWSFDCDGKYFYCQGDLNRFCPKVVARPKMPGNAFSSVRFSNILRGSLPDSPRNDGLKAHHIGPLDPQPSTFQKTPAT